MALQVPEVTLNSGGKTPVLGFGTASDPPASPEAVKQAVMQAIKVGYRHFDTAALYHTEQCLGEVIAEAIEKGLIKSREELFITSKLWCTDAHENLVLPAIKKTLKNLNMEYIDLYLIHWPVSAKPGVYEYPIKPENFRPMDFKAVWAEMEECQRQGLTKAIGVSNFSAKKIGQILSTATITPACNQVEINPVWQQKELIDFCKKHGILVVAYAPLGAIGTFYGTNRVLECEQLKEIAAAKGKTVAQICLRWAYEQGIGVVVKSYNAERMKQNIDIFSWELSREETEKISAIPQSRACIAYDYTSPMGPYKSVEEIWDEEKH